MFDSSRENARTSGEQETTSKVLFGISPGDLASAALAAASQRLPAALQSPHSASPAQQLVATDDLGRQQRAR